MAELCCQKAFAICIFLELTHQFVGVQLLLTAQMKFFTPGSMLADSRDKADCIFVISSGRSELVLHLVLNNYITAHSIIYFLLPIAKNWILSLFNKP